jgi:hypothetical protein
LKRFLVEKLYIFTHIEVVTKQVRRLGRWSFWVVGDC